MEPTEAVRQGSETVLVGEDAFVVPRQAASSEISVPKLIRFIF